MCRSLVELVAGKLPHLNLLAIDLFSDHKLHPIEEQKFNESEPNLVDSELIGYSYIRSIQTHKYKHVLSLEDSELSNRKDSPAFLSQIESFCPRSKKFNGYQVDWMRDRQFIREINCFNQGHQILSAQYDGTNENLVSFVKTDPIGQPIIIINSNPNGYPGSYIVETQDTRYEYLTETLNDLKDPIFTQNYDIDLSHLEHMKRSAYQLLMNRKLNRVIALFLKKVS